MSNIVVKYKSSYFPEENAWFWQGQNNGFGFTFGITHWMPLPLPPKNSEVDKGE